MLSIGLAVTPARKRFLALVAGVAGAAIAIVFWVPLATLIATIALALAGGVAQFTSSETTYEFQMAAERVPEFDNPGGGVYDIVEAVRLRFQGDHDAALIVDRKRAKSLHPWAGFVTVRFAVAGDWFRGARSITIVSIDGEPYGGHIATQGDAMRRIREAFSRGGH